MKKITFRLITLSFLSILLAPSVHAQNFGNNVVNTDNIKKNIENRQDKVEDRQQKIQDKKEEIQQNREERRDQICENIENRIKNKLKKFYTNKSTHISKYSELIQKIEKIIFDLDQKGFDTSDLEAHLKELHLLVQDYAQSYVTFIDELEDSQENACGQSEGAFKQNMKQSRSYFKTVVEKRKEIRKYYAEVIREDIKDIREQAKEMYEEGVEISDSQEE